MTRTWRIVAVTALAAAGVLGALGAGAFSSPPSHTKSYQDGYVYGASQPEPGAGPWTPGESIICMPVLSAPRGDNPDQWGSGCAAGFQ
jgi:hypothetical protein